MRECLLLGGGERSRGDKGQRGVSLISEVLIAFGGAEALAVTSEWAGRREGIEAEDNAR